MAATELAPRLPADAGEIARLLRQLGPLSRADLALATGLSRTALNARLDVLRDWHLLSDVGPGESNGGRPPALVAFAREGGTVIGIDLGATSVDVGITDLGGELLVSHGAPIDVRRGPDEVLGSINGIIDGLFATNPSARRNLRGIGIGVPGPVEFRTGRPVAPPIMPGWDQFPVREHFEDRYSAPTFVDNDVNVMAAGESWAGRGSDVPDFLWIKLGSGIGCGVVNGGRVYRGANGCAGDIGHIQFGDSRAVCRCGNLGCLEAIAGGYALARAAERLAVSGDSPALVEMRVGGRELSSADLQIAVGRGDPASIELVRSAGAAVGTVLAGLVNFYNPNLIVIGGRVAQLGDLLIASIREAIYRRSLPLATRDITIASTALGTKAGVVGAAAVVLDQLFQLGPERAVR